MYIVIHVCGHTYFRHPTKPSFLHTGTQWPSWSLFSQFSIENIHELYTKVWKLPHSHLKSYLLFMFTFLWVFPNPHSTIPSLPHHQLLSICTHIYVAVQRISSKWSSSLSASHKIHCWFYLYPLLLRWYLYKISCSLFEWKNLMEMFTTNNISAWTEYLPASPSDTVL